MAQRLCAARPDAWLFRILRNAWLDMIRRNQTRGTEIEIDAADDAATVDGRSVVETRLMPSAAGAAMANLPVDQREVMTLISVEDFT